MAKKKRPAAEPGSDRYLCPSDIPGLLGVRRHVIAGALRAAGRVEPLTRAEALRWRNSPEDAPAQGMAVLTAVAEHRAQREHRARQERIEEEHRLLLLTAKVERRLLAGAKHFRNSDAEFIATDMAVRASKELVRSNGDLAHLLPLDLAALRWAGVDPANHATWVIHGGDCEGGPRRSCWP